MICEKKLIEDIENDRTAFRSELYTDDSIRAYFIGAVEEQPKVGEWISCKERLPEYDYYTALCVTDTNFWAVMVYTKEHGFRSGDLDFNGEVIAWQPLPEPYREE